MTELELWLEEKKKELDAYPFHSNPSRVSYIVMHHSFSKDGKERNWDAIRKYHMSYRYNGMTVSPEVAKVLHEQGKTVEMPWVDIGYHFGIELVGNDYQIVNGRQLDKRGAHVGQGGFNRMSIGICMVGNFDERTPPDRQWILGLLLVKRLTDYLATKAMVIKNENVIGHREAQALAGVPLIDRKSCPGKMFDMNLFRKDLAAMTH